MAELKAFSSHRAMPAHLEGLLEDQAWGRVIQAFKDGLSVNLVYDGNQTLFSAVTYLLAEAGSAATTTAAYGPLALIEAFIAHGLNHYLLPQVSAVANVVAGGQWEWLDQLLKAGYPVEAPGGRSVFHAMVEGRMARRLRGREEQWENLERGVNFFVFNGDLPLERAALVDATCKLVAHGADIEVEEATDPGEPSITALQVAIMYGDVAMVEALLTAGALVHFDPGEDPLGINSLHPLSIAAKEGLVHILDQLLTHSGLDVLGHHGVDAMHVAASCGHVACMKKLHQHGIDYHAPTRHGEYVPLHQAALHGQIAAIDLLLAHGASWEQGGEFTASSVLCTHHAALARSYKLDFQGNNVLPFRPARPGVAK